MEMCSDGHQEIVFVGGTMFSNAKCPICTMTEEHQEEVEELQGEIENLKNEIQHLESSLTDEL